MLKFLFKKKIINSSHIPIPDNTQDSLQQQQKSIPRRVSYPKVLIARANVRRPTS